MRVVEKMEELPPVSHEIAAHLLQCTKPWVLTLVDDGWIKRHGSHRYYHFYIPELMAGQAAFLKKQRISPADIRIKEARAAEIEVRNAERVGRMIDVEEVAYILKEFVGLVRSKHAGVAAMVTRDLAIRRIIDRVLNGLDSELADMFEELAETMSTARQYPAPTIVSAPRPVGGQEPDLSTNGAGAGST